MEAAEKMSRFGEKAKRPPWWGNEIFSNFEQDSTSIDNIRIVCTFLSAVMLLGAVPAYAAAPLSHLAAILAIPVSRQLMNSGPVSDSISKASTVERIETTYSTETKSAPTSAPVEQTTFATTAPARLADGTTGATAGLIGKATVTMDELQATYPCRTGLSAMKRDYPNGWRLCNDWKRVGNGECLTSGTIVCLYDASVQSPKDLVGGTIPAG